MTEAEWLACTELHPMLEFLRDRVSARKLRLFSCACCRRIWHLISSQDCARKAVEAAERYTDGLLGDTEWADLYYALVNHYYKIEDRAEEAIVAKAALATMAEFTSPGFHRTIAGAAFEARQAATRAFSRSTGHSETPEEVRADLAREGSEQAVLLREVIGPQLFRPCSVNLYWLTPTVKAVAQAIYEDSLFQDLPILADALEDAGCAEEQILTHLRSPGPHVRGCWPLDLILGKS